jgi:hypothetical protein
MHAHHTTYQEGISGGSILRCHLPCKGVNFRLPKPCQGADEKTRVREDTRNVLFYAYAVPGIEARYLQEGLAIAAVVMAEFGIGSVEQVEIY